MLLLLLLIMMMMLAGDVNRIMNVNVRAMFAVSQVYADNVLDFTLNISIIQLHFIFVLLYCLFGAV